MEEHNWFSAVDKEGVLFFTGTEDKCKEVVRILGGTYGPTLSYIKTGQKFLHRTHLEKDLKTHVQYKISKVQKFVFYTKPVSGGTSSYAFNAYAPNFMGIHGKED